MNSDPNTDTGWTFFHIKLLQKLQCLFEKDIKNEAGKCRFSKECCEEHTFNSESKWTEQGTDSKINYQRASVLFVEN